LIKDEIEKRVPFVQVVQGPGSGRIPTNLSGVNLEPGAAIGAQLVTGDIDLTAVGTLTYVDEDGRFLAFGHPFLMAGYIEMPITTARIIHTVPSIMRSFKMGEAIELVGRIEQDRYTCVAGRFGETPDMMDISVTVKDEDLDWKETYECSSIRDDEMMPFFWLIAPMEAIMRTMDRSGGGVIEVSFKVDADTFDEPISMENIFYSADASASWFAISELSSILDSLTSRNIYRDAKINSIELEINVRDEHRTIDILKVRSIMPPEREEEAKEEGEEEVEEIEEEIEEGEIEEGAPEEEEVEAYEFIKRRVPMRALVNLASSAVGREIIRLNAGDEVLEAVKEYVESKEEEEKEFYEVPQYYPGETVEATVLMQPYRGEPYEQVIGLEIPEDFPPGIYDVNVSGGNFSYGNSMMGMSFLFTPFIGGFMGGYAGNGGPETLDELIEDLTDREPNDALVMSLGPIPDEDPYAYLREDFEPPEPIKSVIPMDGVVYGSFYLPIEVLTPEGEEVEEGEAEMPLEDIPEIKEGMVPEEGFEFFPPE
jgi:hypothetical protein